MPNNNPEDSLPLTESATQSYVQAEAQSREAYIQSLMNFAPRVNPVRYTTEVYLTAIQLDTSGRRKPVPEEKPYPCFKLGMKNVLDKLNK